jgi:hypothetical protein
MVAIVANILDSLFLPWKLKIIFGPWNNKFQAALPKETGERSKKITFTRQIKSVIGWSSVYLTTLLLLPRLYKDVSESFRTGRLERELQMVQLSATRCSCTAILWVSLVSFAAVTLYVASQRVFIVVRIYFIIDSVRKLLVTPSYIQPFVVQVLAEPSIRLL